jgi:pimeloyl-ACP methyl ester carboxylesterase
VSTKADVDSGSSLGTKALKVAGIGLGVAAGVAGAVYVAQRKVLQGLSDRPDPDAGRLGDLPLEGARTFRSHDGGEIFVLEAGPEDGVPIVLSHGVTIDSRIWTKQFESLPPLGFRVIAFDTRGHGKSVCGTSGHSIENLAFDVRALLEELDLHDTILLGHSMGGVAVQAFASHLPEVAHERVRGLVLLSSLAKTQVSTTRRLRALAESVSGKLDLSHMMGNPNLGTMLARLGFGRDPQASHVELVRQMLAECDPETTRDAVSVLLGMDLTPKLELIDLPTLIICGTNDVLAPRYESRRIARLIRGARFVMLEGAGHTIMLEQPEELDALLVDFAQELGLLPGSSPHGRNVATG